MGIQQQPHGAGAAPAEWDQIFNQQQQQQGRPGGLPMQLQPPAPPGMRMMGPAPPGLASQFQVRQETNKLEREGRRGGAGAKRAGASVGRGRVSRME